MPGPEIPTSRTAQYSGRLRDLAATRVSVAFLNLLERGLSRGQCQPVRAVPRDAAAALRGGPVTALTARKEPIPVPSGLPQPPWRPRVFLLDPGFWRRIELHPERRRLYGPGHPSHNADPPVSSGIAKSRALEKATDCKHRGHAFGQSRRDQVFPAGAGYGFG